tara:strand:- start:1446 stop:1769 length:324 start_codon:yes stop_codon:yes gene_type:complete
MATVAIFSPKGNGQMMVGAWSKPWSPQDCIRANPGRHGFKVLSREELERLEKVHGDMLPQAPGEWSVLDDRPQGVSEMTDEEVREGLRLLLRLWAEAKKQNRNPQPQ